MSEQQPKAPPRELVLPSGKKASIDGRITGRHQQRALRMIGKEASTYTFALIAVSCTIDGRALTLEDVLDLDATDVDALQPIVLGKETKEAGPT